MAENILFKRKTPLERLQEQKKAKAEKVSKSKEKYEESRVRGFNVDWKENHDWLDYVSLADMYPHNVEAVTNTLLTIKSERTKSDDGTTDEVSVANVMICVPCREKHYADNHIPMENYVPTKSDFKKYPYVFGSVSFRVQTIEKHSSATNSFHDLAVKRKFNLSSKEAGSSKSEGQKALLAMNEAQRNRLKMLFINTYALMVKGRPYSEYEHYVKMDKVKGLDIGASYLNRRKLWNLVL